jgi:alkylresorcinol/alkylpyrone synthase
MAWTSLARSNRNEVLTASQLANWTGHGSMHTLGPLLSEAIVQKSTSQRAGARASFNVEIAAVACAVPKHKVSQEAIAVGAKRFFPHLKGSSGLFDNTGIESRYVCEPQEWYFESRGWEERTASFQHNALALLEEATLKAAAAAGVCISDIAAIVTNTVTGLAVPSLEAQLLNRLPFSRSVERLPIFGLGCGGGVGGLARATRIAETMPGGHVLFLTVDLCSLCARGDDPSLANFVSIALFGDGAAAVLLRKACGGGAHGGALGRIVSLGEHCWADTLGIMGWDVKENGFGVVLSPELPSLLRRELRPVMEDFLAREGLALDEVSSFLLHPGGRRVLETAQEVLGLTRGDLIHSWEVLRQFGNMSSATALFILERALASGARGRHLLAAFGPGFSAYFVVLDL